MKFIDNRFRIWGNISEALSNERYLAVDLLNDRTMKNLTVYRLERDQDTIDFFKIEYSNIKKIRHKNIVVSESFQKVETINFKKNDVPIYYTVSEYIDSPLLSMVNRKLKFKEKLKIILDLMNVISYLHFKGITYGYLDPDNIFILSNMDIKLMDLGTIMSNIIAYNYNDFTKRFIAPEIIQGIDNRNRKSDYYSLGMIIRYLLCPDFCTKDCMVFDSKCHFSLKDDEKQFLEDIIHNLTQEKSQDRDIYLRKHMDNIIDKFKLDYKYDLISKSPIEIMSLDTNMTDNKKYDIGKYYSIGECVETLEELLCNLGQDCQRNLDSILSYIQGRTLADSGYIILLDGDIDKYKIISSLSEHSGFLINEKLLDRASNSDMGILCNVNLKDIDNSDCSEFLPDGAVAIMCISITSKDTRSIAQEDREYVNKNKCYVYLESRNYFNNFNYDNLILLKTLSNMIYLNLENHLLRITSTIDKLTGVLTRKWVDTELDLAIARYNRYGGQFSLLMIDIDNFKDINDSYGHLKGDKVLMKVGNIIKDSVKEVGLVGRYGGEEFILILFDVNIDDAIMVGEKLRKRIEGLKIKGIDKRITISGGLSNYPFHGCSKNELIGKADGALYYAKQVLGKNHVIMWTYDMGESFVDY